MATLLIKNKYEVSFRKLVRESRTDGGIPDVIHVNGKEAWDILNEIRAVGLQGFEIEAGDEYDPKFILKASKEKIEKDAATDIVKRWWLKDFGVLFLDGDNKIPIHVIHQPKPKPEGPPNEKIKPEGVPDNKPTPEGPAE